MAAADDPAGLATSGHLSEEKHKGLVAAGVAPRDAVSASSPPFYACIAGRRVAGRVMQRQRFQSTSKSSALRSFELV